MHRSSRGLTCSSCPGFAKGTGQPRQFQHMSNSFMAHAGRRRVLNADGELGDRRLAGPRTPVAAAAQRIGRCGHRLEAHHVLGERREDLGGRIPLLEVHFQAASAAGHGENRAIAHLVVGIVKSLVAQWL